MKISRRCLLRLGNVVQALAEIPEATVDAEAPPSAGAPMTTLLLTHGRRTVCALAVGDLVLMALGLGGLAVMFEGAGATAGASSTQLAAMAGFVLFQLVVLNAFGLQAPTARFRDWRYSARLALTLAMGLAVLGGVSGLCGLAIDPAQLGASLLALFFLLFAVRYVVLGLVFPRSRRRRLAVVGEMPAAMELVRRVRSEPFTGYSIVRICVPESQMDDSSSLDLEADRIEVTDEVGKLLGSSDFDAIAFDPRCHTFSDRDLCRLAELSGSGIAVYELAALSKGLAGRFPKSSLDPARVAEAICARNASDRVYSAAKRAIDIAIAAVALLVAAVPMLCVALIVKLDSAGPALLGQARVGYRGRVFRCLKFRTMTKSADRDGPAWTAEGDPRITRVGGYLRKTRLDELPQLVNVLKGDMSLVGPRPVLETVAEPLRAEIPLYDIRHTIRPGLTGWAQVKQGYAGGRDSEMEKLRYDLYYIEKRSFAFDTLILIMTAQIVIGGCGR
jgi:exopolysaccharide biosynthesis polyprenyl glycosylphosphotransferase